MYHLLMHRQGRWPFGTCTSQAPRWQAAAEHSIRQWWTLLPAARRRKRDWSRAACWAAIDKAVHVGSTAQMTAAPSSFPLPPSAAHTPEMHCSLPCDDCSAQLDPLPPEPTQVHELHSTVSPTARPHTIARCGWTETNRREFRSAWRTVGLHRAQAPAQAHRPMQ
eukprot:COSAG02_NODE_1569_length_11894_cov_51.145994_12_plen_165_part_00